jgi:acyl-CoA reductase-like NAD-dependent aldehyde dehydrogenase
VLGVTPDHILGQLVDRHRGGRAEFELGGDTGYSWVFDELTDAWRAAQAEAVDAYEHWRETPGADAFAVYRAVQDRADQAQDVLAERAARERSAAPAKRTTGLEPATFGLGSRRSTN